MIIELDQGDVVRAAKQGAMKRIVSAFSGMTERFAPANDPLGFSRDILGAMGELAVSKATGLPWTDEFDHRPGGADVGKRCMVRTTPDNPKFNCVINPWDKEGFWFFFVFIKFPPPRGRNVRCEIPGFFLHESFVKTKSEIATGEIANGKGSLIIPRSALKPVERLVE